MNLPVFSWEVHFDSLHSSLIQRIKGGREFFRPGQPIQTSTSYLKSYGQAPIFTLMITEPASPVANGAQQLLVASYPCPSAQEVVPSCKALEAHDGLVTFAL
jgi:hypothetical protein